MKFGKLFKTSAIFSVIFALAAGALPVVIAQSGPPKQEKLLNGLKVLMWNDAKADSVSVRVRVHSGSAFDPQGKEGVMQLLADSLFPNEAAREFFEEDLGGSLEVVGAFLGAIREKLAVAEAHEDREMIGDGRNLST